MLKISLPLSCTWLCMLTDFPCLQVGKTHYPPTQLSWPCRATYEITSLTYPGHSNHELDYKSLETSHDVSNKKFITENWCLTGLKLYVQKHDKMANLSPWRVTQTTWAEGREEGEGVRRKGDENERLKRRGNGEMEMGKETERWVEIEYSSHQKMISRQLAVVPSTLPM